MSKERRVTSSRLGRFTQLGSLAGGIAGGMASEGVRQLAQGRRPSVSDLLLSPANTRRLGESLSEMRGAAMKVGQLISMDGGNLLPTQLSEMLAGLRDSAHRMPLGQVAQILKQNWGEGWESRFSRFSFTPLAAASIGQVHEAVLKDGRALAIKLQYPGIRRSIDSDVDNVAALLRLFRVLPTGFDIAPLLSEAKEQLHAEADYLREAQALQRFAAHLEDDPRFELPLVETSLTTPEVLSMSRLGGQPIESLTGTPARTRNAVATALVELAFREVFDWGLVQTDPNFANYLYDPGKGRIQLLDFGAARDYPAPRRSALAGLLDACIRGTDQDVARAAATVGYMAEEDPAGYRDSIVRLLRTATEPARGTGDYRFTGNDLARRMSDTVVKMRIHEGFARIPPPDILFLHRKLGGLYLLLTRLRATLPMHDLVGARLATGEATTTGTGIAV